MKQKYSLIMAILGLFLTSQIRAQGQVESLYFNEELTTAESFYLSDDDSEIDGFYYKTSFTSGSFNLNHYWSEWGFGGGFTYSNCTDVTTPGFNNLSAYAGAGQSGDTYLISNSSDFTPAEITFKEGKACKPLGAYFTNSSYAALAMLNGNAPARKFGGETGTEEDWFLLTITGYNAAGEMTNSVDFYLADYRFEDSTEDYIVKDWTWVDLSSLGEVNKLGFSMTSSDNGDYGMNTPSYFCMDGLQIEAGPLSGMEHSSLAQASAFYANGLLHISGLEGSKAYLYDKDGNQIQTLSVDSDSFRTSLTVWPGIYLLKVDGSHTYTFKIAINQ